LKTFGCRWLRGGVCIAFSVLLALPGCWIGNEQIDFNVTYIPPNEFLLGPEDVLVVNVWRNQELSREVIIRPDGKISMPLIGHVRETLGPSAAAQGVSVALECAEASLVVPGDRDELIRLFENLTQNAIKYGSEGKKVETTEYPQAALVPSTTSEFARSLVMSA